MFFLQVGSDEGAILPPLEYFEVSSGLMGQNGGKKAKWTPPCLARKKSVGDLFKEFIQFYHSVFDWRKEAISIRLGKRAAPDVRLPLHIVLHDDKVTSEV